MSEQRTPGAPGDSAVGPSPDNSYDATESRFGEPLSPENESIFQPPVGSTNTETPTESTRAQIGMATHLAGEEDRYSGDTTPLDAIQEGALLIAVSDINGFPLPGARIRIDDADERPVGSRGEYYLDTPPEPPFSVEASHPGYRSQTRALSLEDIEAARIQLRLIPLNAMTGRVIDNLGNPIQGAEVRANAETGIWVSNVRTDQRGIFTLSSPPEAMVRIEAAMEGYSDEGAGRATVESPQSETIVLRLEMPTLSISGFVFRQEDGLGVEGVMISASQEGGGGSGTAVTGSDGSYRITDLPKGSYSVQGMDSADSNTIFIPGEETKQVRLIEWDVKDVNFTVSESYTVIGRVMLSDGRALQGASVSVDGLTSTSSPSSLSRQGQRALSGVDGGFILSQVPLPVEEGVFHVRLVAIHDEYGVGYSEPLPPSSRIHSHEALITLEANTASIHGEVVTKQGGVIADARVAIFLAYRGLDAPIKVSQTDVLGEFTLEGIPTGDEQVHRLTVYKEGYAEYQAQLRLQPGENKRIEIVLDAAGEIGGRVTDQHGSPIANAQVTARALRRSARPVMTDEQGLYRIDNLAEDVYDVIVNYTGSPPLSGALYQVMVGSMDANVTLNRAQWIVSGPVWDAQRDVAIHRYSIGIEGSPSSPRGRPFFEQRDFNTPDGHYSLTLTEPGEYRLRFFADGYEAQERRVRIAPEIPDFQYIGAGLEPIQGEGEIAGTFIANPGVELTAIQVIGLRAFPVNNNVFNLQGVPTGLHDLIFYIHEIGSGARYPLGVLSSVPVESNGRTDLGALGPLNFNAYVRDGIIAD